MNPERNEEAAPGVQSREVAVPGTRVAFVENILYAQTGNQIHLFQIEGVGGMQVELREAGSPTVAGAPATALQMAVQVDVDAFHHQ